MEPVARGHAYNVAQAEVYTAESWIEAAAGVLGVRARYAHVAEAELGDLELEGCAAHPPPADSPGYARCQRDLAPQAGLCRDGDQLSSSP